MPLTGDALAAQQVQERLRSLQQIVHEIEKKRQQSEAGINALQKFHAGYEDKMTSQHQSKLKALLKTTLNQAEQEEDAIRKALEKINEIRNIKNERQRLQARSGGNKELIRSGTRMKMLFNSAQTLPLFVGKVGEKPPPLCGAIPAEPGYVAKVGDMVVALVKVTESDEDDWIIAEVSSFNASTNKYEVYDILKEQNQKAKHILSKRWVIPLPLMRANPETDSAALFPKGAVVMALYPTTTCFYKALVNKPPQTHMDQYELIFEDSTYPEGYAPPLNVAQRYVVAFKAKPKQNA